MGAIDMVLLSGRFEETLNSSHVRIIKLFCVLLLFAHWNACLIYLVATLDEFEKSWVADNGLLEAAEAERYVAMLMVACAPTTVSLVPVSWRQILHCIVQLAVTHAVHWLRSNCTFCTYVVCKFSVATGTAALLICLVLLSSCCRRCGSPFGACSPVHPCTLGSLARSLR